MLDNFVDDGTCRAILDELKFLWWTPSGTLARDKKGELIARQSICRTSASSTEHWLSDAPRRRLRQIERRLTRQLGVSQDCLDPWQIIRYRRGGRFDEHHDAGLFRASMSGERVATLLLYLDDQPGATGATVFPAFGERICPRAGRLVAWRNLDDDGSIDPRMTHYGAPARRTKTLLTTWLRERSARACTGGKNAQAYA